MFLALVLLTLGYTLSRHSHTVSAATCWRDTTCTGPLEPAFPGAWEANNFSPSSRILSPTQILYTNGTASPFPGQAELKNGSLLVFDFGKEVGGIVTVSYSAFRTGTLGLAFSEAKNWTGLYSDDSNGSFDPNGHPDGALSVNITATSSSTYAMPDSKMRGGFRYLSLFANGDEEFAVEVLNVTVEISFAPAWSNLRAYGGYFDSSDELLNKIWYAGAYTLQTNAVPPSTGRRFPVTNGWENDQQLNLGTEGSTIYVDGSKRDRTVWAGDLAIAVPSVLVSTGDVEGVRNTLQVLLNDQASTGALPFAGPGLNIYNSDTYHMATLIGIYEYYLFTKDDAFMTTNWDRYVKAVSFITNKIDETGLLYVTGTEDWGRDGQGAHNTEANMLMYKTLTSASSIGAWMGDSNMASTLTAMAAKLKDVVNVNCWDAAGGAFGDSEGDNSRHPQDGNSMALLFNATNSTSMQSVSSALTLNWITIGSLAPELPNNLIGFGQSFEIKAHLAAHQATRALDLIRRAWGWYLSSPFGTGSTCIEGYLSDGSFGYRSTTGYGGDYSYTSHAHGWSTGPTDALTSYVVGLKLTSPGGGNWTLAPQFGDLEWAEAGFTTPLGMFQASWQLIEGGYSLSWGFPGGAMGVLELPVLGRVPRVESEGSEGARIMQVGTLEEGEGEMDGRFVVREVSEMGALKVFY